MRTLNSLDQMRPILSHGSENPSPHDPRDLAVLHVVSHLDSRMGGSIIAAFSIADAVQDEGLSCTMVGVSGEGTRSEDYFKQHFPRLRLEVFPMQFPRRSFNSLPLWRWLRRKAAEFDVVHVHGLFNFPYLYGARAAVRGNVPLVISPHGSLDPFDLRKRAALKRFLYGPWIVGPILSHAAVVLCTSTLEAQRLETFGAKPAPRTATISLPVGVPAEAPVDSSWRERNGIPKSDVVVLFLSRVDVKKGLELLIPAFARVSRTFAGVTLVIAGEGDSVLRARLQQMAESAGVTDKVRWVGFVSGTEKQSAYACCDLFALPSHNENFGLVVVEALYAAKPVLISREVYLAETLQSGGCAAVCDTTVDSVHRELWRLVSDAEYRRSLAARARLVALREFSPAAVRARLRQVYQSVIPSLGSGVPVGE